MRHRVIGLMLEGRLKFLHRSLHIASLRQHGCGSEMALGVGWIQSQRGSIFVQGFIKILVEEQDGPHQTMGFGIRWIER